MVLQTLNRCHTHFCLNNYEMLSHLKCSPGPALWKRVNNWYFCQFIYRPGWIINPPKKNWKRNVWNIFPSCSSSSSRRGDVEVECDASQMFLQWVHVSQPERLFILPRVRCLGDERPTHRSRRRVPSGISCQKTEVSRQHSVLVIWAEKPAAARC